MSFQAFFDAGYTDLVPVIPPGARLNLFSKVKPEQKGKVPGRKRPDGTWTGMKDWLEVQADPETLAGWAKWYDGVPSVGLRATRFPAVDIDVEDERLARIVRSRALKILGDAPERTRADSAKSLLVYTTDAPFKRMRLWFQHGETTHLIEVLGDGNQYLVEGIHTKGEPYELSGAFTPNLPRAITADLAQTFLEAVQADLAAAGCTEFRLEGSVRLAEERVRVEQPGLEAPSLEELTALVARLPNTTDLFPSRDDYLKVGYAIKASWPHDEGAALALWTEWSLRWEGENSAEVVESDWSRLQPPFTIGYDYLREQARRAGVGLAEEEFADICDPPLPPVPEDPDADGAVPYSDAWLAARFLRVYGDRVRYNDQLGGWLVWDGSRWALDRGNLVAAWVAKTCRDAGRKALGQKGGALIAKDCASDKRRRSVQSYAMTDPRINVPVEAFDADPWALNTPQGVIDLRTGALTPADPGRLFTRCTATAPARMPTPRWNRFLKEATGNDPELVAYLARLAGYALTGSTREHILAFLWGPGGNGKGVFLNTLVRLFGSYASVAAMDTFTSSRFDRHPAELATLVGARLVTAQETQEDRSWDEAKVKSITGGDPITARFMRQDFFTYEPQFKLLFAGNHRPHIRNLDDAMRRRFHLVPFTYRPAVPDQTLPERLQSEWPGILQWVIDGCLAWQAHGLEAPAVVLEATESYFVDEDPVGRWLAERVVLGGDGAVDTRALFNDYRLWCLEQNEKPGIERAFVQTLRDRGLERWRDPKTRRRGLSGIALRSAFDALPPPGQGEARFLH